MAAKLPIVAIHSDPRETIFTISTQREKWPEIFGTMEEAVAAVSESVGEETRIYVYNAHGRVVVVTTVLPALVWDSEEEEESQA
jgi:hypothetical protein